MYFHCPYSICLPRPFFNELLRHGGGANVSVDTNRCAFTAQYCQPWVRQQENMMLSFPWMVGEVSGLVDSGGFVEPLSFLRCHVYTSNRLANLLRMMSVPFQEVQELPEAIQSMIGYSIHPPFIGHVDGRHPLKAAERLAKLWRQLWWLRVTVMSDCFQTFGICCHWFGKFFFFFETPCWHFWSARIWQIQMKDSWNLEQPDNRHPSKPPWMLELHLCSPLTCILWDIGPSKRFCRGFKAFKTEAFTHSPGALPAVWRLKRLIVPLGRKKRMLTIHTFFGPSALRLLKQTLKLANSKGFILIA